MTDALELHDAGLDSHIIEIEEEWGKDGNKDTIRPVGSGRDKRTRDNRDDRRNNDRRRNRV